MVKSLHCSPVEKPSTRNPGAGAVFSLCTNMHDISNMHVQRLEQGCRFHILLQSRYIESSGVILPLHTCRSWQRRGTYYRHGSGQRMWKVALNSRWGERSQEQGAVLRGHTSAPSPATAISENRRFLGHSLERPTCLDQSLYGTGNWVKGSCPTLMANAKRFG